MRKEPEHCQSNCQLRKLSKVLGLARSSFDRGYVQGVRGQRQRKRAFKGGIQWDIAMNKRDQSTALVVTESHVIGASTQDASSHAGL